MPAGRPSKYKPEFADQLKEYFLTTGREQTSLPTVEGFAEFIDVDTDTINVWAVDKDDSGKLKHPEFSGAIKELKSRQRKQLMDDGLYGGKDINAAMAIFLLKANHDFIETEKRIFANDKENPLMPSYIDFNES